MNVFLENAYNVLGLEASASSRETSRRSRELTTRLKMGDTPKYDEDILDPKIFRTVDNIRSAESRLASPKDRALEYVFAFRPLNDTDRKALKFARGGRRDDAIAKWRSVAAGESERQLLYKKNLALLFSLYLSEEYDNTLLKESIKLWAELLNSDTFWRAISKAYQTDNELGVDSAALEGVRERAVSAVSKTYVQLGKRYEKPEIAEDFTRAFGVKGSAASRQVLDPKFLAVHEIVKELEDLDASADGVLDDGERRQIKSLIKKAQAEFNKLVDLGVYESSEAISLRDRFSEGIRTVALDLHNNLSEMDLSQKLLETSATFAGSKGLQARLKQDINQVDINRDSEVLDVEIPGGFRKRVIEIRNTYMEYKGTRINYSDAESVMWNSTRHSTNGIPTTQTYAFALTSATGSKIDISFSAGFRGREKHNTAFGTLVGAASHFIEPVIVRRLVSRIFDKHQRIQIGSVEMDEYGLYKSHFFKGPALIPWSDIKYVPQIEAGFVSVSASSSAGIEYAENVPLSTPNAAVLPELINRSSALGRDRKPKPVTDVSQGRASSSAPPDGEGINWQKIAIWIGVGILLLFIFG